MKYASGGVSGTLGQDLEVVVPLAAKAGQKAEPIAKENGEDVLVDPPVRNLPQWDQRWGKTRIAGPRTGAMLDWQANGCNASTAAMTLRWFAEDCPAGKIPFPQKPGGSVNPAWYGPRMGEAFWPKADPPGKVALDKHGRIDTSWIYAVCAHYLQTGGDLPRAASGDVDHPKKAFSVESEPKEGWLATLRKLLKSGPVIMGIGAPSGHYVIAHAVIGGAVAIVDPGNVLYSARHGGKGEIQNWSSIPGYLDAGKDLANADKVRMPKASQWPHGSPPGNEGDSRAYNLVSGQFLDKLLQHLQRLVSLTHPGGAKFDGAPAQPAEQDSPHDDGPVPQHEAPDTHPHQPPPADHDEHDSASADWRPYIGKDSVPDEILEAVRHNRARYPQKTLPRVTSGKYAGEHHYDYKPPDDHYQWAKGYFSKKLDSPPGGNRNVVRAFLLMLRNEGRPASFQTYDNQIVTWGVGLGAKGDGVHAFEHLNQDAGMRKLLDGIGVQYFDGDYHIVDLHQKKVVSSAAGKKGDDSRHVVALESWRRQLDAMTAIIGLSEDPATREAVAESQYAVYLSNSTRWGGQDKVFTLALYFMITHMYQWLPAIAKYGFDVNKEFAAAGGGTPSVDTDKKLAPRIALAFIRQAKKYSQTHKLDYDDVRTRTKTHLWKQMRDDGKAEGFDPGELVYED